jgi:signal transduction histidine kinase
VRLRFKLVLAISAMVAGLVAMFGLIYVRQMVRAHLEEAQRVGDLVRWELFWVTHRVMETDLSSTRVDTDNPAELRSAIQELLVEDAGVNEMMDSIIGYSPILQDAAIVGADGRVMLDSNPGLIGKRAAPRPPFEGLRRAGFWQQLRTVFGEARVFEISMPLVLGNCDEVSARSGRPCTPFGEIRIGISTVFMEHELRPLVRRAEWVAGLALLLTIALAVGMSNIALRPAIALERQLDLISEGGQADAPAPLRRDEYGAVTTKIDRLGRNYRSVQEVYSAMKEDLNQVMANLRYGLMFFTPDWHVGMVSASAEQFVGRSGGEVLRRRVDEVFSRESPLGAVVLQAFQDHQPLAGAEIDAGGGRRTEVSLDFIEQDGEGIGALLTMRDAESLRRIESDIELSRLASGVVHEVRNPLNAMVIHIEHLRMKLQGLEAVQSSGAEKHLEVITDEIQRLNRAVQMLVEFTRLEPKMAEADLRKVLDDVATLAAPEAERLGVHIEHPQAGDALPVLVDADLLKQALLNVVVNGVQAMPKGGTLTLDAFRQDGQVQVAIQDRGPGIPPEIRDKVFNLYFTTKGRNGSGMGLALTQRIMRLHNGSVDFESIAGQGTTFHLRLPLAPQPAMNRPPAAPGQLTAL